MNTTEQRYRTARTFAQRLAQFLSGQAGITVTVSDGANVHLVEDGAFVEAMLWVPLAEPVLDDVGRIVAPAQQGLRERPAGPWDGNKENRP